MSAIPEYEVLAASPADAASYTIHPLETLDELRACVRLQEEVWGPGFSQAAPVSIIKVSQRLGGVVGAAFDADGEMVAFVFGLTGIERGDVVHWSHMLAVRPGLRNAGLGRRLKSWQRERCRAVGVRRMYWTFDPLESRNAWLNLGRLGIVVREYVQDLYGASDSPLHQGIGTDRFVASWVLDDPRVEERLAGRGVPPPSWSEVRELPRAFTVTFNGDLPRPGPVETSATVGDALLVPVPADIQEVKAADPELAVAWREATRGVLLSRLGAGWEVTELVRSPEPVSYYLLRPVAR